jgi:hypothetical protein
MKSVVPLVRGVLRSIKDAAIVIGGIGGFYLRGKMPDTARLALLRLHCRTNGRATAMLTPWMRAVRPAPAPKPVTGLLGTLTVQKQKEVAAALGRDGFYIFEQRLPQSLCDKIEAFARQVPAKVEGSDKLELFDQDRPISKTYRIQEHDIVKSPAMQEFMSDPSVMAVASVYLKTLPILSGMNLWFSPAYGNAPGDHAAQEYHFDFDPPPIWLLFFVYLTDVGPDNGPHVFVRGTHMPGKKGMGNLLSRGYVRIPDVDIIENFGRENIVELYGKRGTVLAVDTRGMHKGKMPVIGHRLMAQLTFSCPPFSSAHGTEVPLPGELSPSLAQALKSAPEVYAARYRAPSSVPSEKV